MLITHGFDNPSFWFSYPYIEEKNSWLINKKSWTYFDEFKEHAEIQLETKKITWKQNPKIGIKAKVANTNLYEKTKKNSNTIQP